MDYLPQSSAGYMGMNMSTMRESAGLKRLGEEMEKMQSGAADFESDKAQKVYIAFDTPAGKSAPPMYGVATGMPGFAEDVVGKYKAAGATSSKTSGHETYTSGPVTISPVGTTGILFYQDAGMLDKMIAVSKKKEPSARASSEFSFVDSQLSDHAMAVATKAEPLLTLAGPMLGQLDAMNPAGGKAVRQVSMISMAFNWDKQPEIDLQLHLADKAQSDALAGLINQALAMAKMMPTLSANADVQQIVGPLQAKAAEDGVKLTVTIPAAVADKLFEQLDKVKEMQQQQMMGQPFGGAPNGMMPAPSGR
jgi:hypothetical protein